MLLMLTTTSMIMVVYLPTVGALSKIVKVTVMSFLSA